MDLDHSILSDLPAGLAHDILAEAGSVHRAEGGDGVGQLRRRHGAGEFDEGSLIDSVDEAGHLADLRVGKATDPEFGDGQRHPRQRAGHADVLPGSARRHGAGPAQPVRGGLQAVEPGKPFSGVEFTDHQEELARGLGDLRRLLLDPSAELLGVGAREPGTRLRLGSIRRALWALWALRTLGALGPLGWRGAGHRGLQWTSTLIVDVSPSEGCDR